MEGATRTAGHRKRVQRSAADPIRCHVVDDHCDALRHIHAAIRRRAVPFKGLGMVHFDAHPDLMLTPDIPAATCFRPHDLYEALAAAEGGIAEWILPLVYQGHLAKLWWIRPPWARQFVDGDYGFSVGQVKASGRLRVSSTAPYFVDDQLYCPEMDMENCRPLDLRVSLAPVERCDPAAWNDSDQPEGGLSSAAQAAQAVTELPAVTTTTARVEEDPSDSRPTPWVLDICLDYFTTENPFIAELESCIGVEDAALVRAFYEKPRFRGATTTLPHDVQVEDERIFRSEVERLLQLGAVAGPAVGGPGVKDTTLSQSPASSVEGTLETLHGDAVPERPPSRAEERGDCSKMIAAKPGRGVAKGDAEEDHHLGLERLTELFSPDGEDRALVGRFASMVARMGSKEREKIAWTDHCACLPRYLATRDEVGASVRKAERLLQSLTCGAGGGGWSGRPGVVTVARSEEDGYVPADMVMFVEEEVLAMLKRLFGEGDDEAGGGGGLEILHDEGLEHPTC